MSRRAVPPPSATDFVDIEVARFDASLTALIGKPAAPVLLAVSGGPDSMAMLSLAAAAWPGRIAVATVDHRLRAEAAAEAAMVADHCATIGVPHATLVPDEPIAGASIQAQARIVRYRLLGAEAKRIGAAAIATAHHVDDQAETFLMRAARGSGLAGLAGVRVRTEVDGVPVVRPLLDWRRAELRAIVRRLEVPFVDDPANHDPAHDRTRFRRLIEGNEWLGPPQLARAAALLAEADADWRTAAAWLWDTRAQVVDGAVTIDVASLPRELRRRLARRAIGAVRDAAGITAPAWSESANVEALLDALGDGRRATQAGVLGSAKRDQWRFRAAPARRTH
ncbi:tRNA(Ile)-lysidine synthase [Sphingomonas jinjuensis]|uniref:tRNA(Ile)-lysidine synthase n=1 Tax=Sphingomonas jinjuensis TaxID=535907 RepID=A0A840FLJ8_9SPHN|nr:tRNA lysidine(34) synthetase TilS [Sphingomonas jinjuensis]MBB4154798.1 tRNA(Ile)-lysidine synthase [Sphingomonas jinjuensis]